MPTKKDVEAAAEHLLLTVRFNTAYPLARRLFTMLKWGLIGYSVIMMLVTMSSSTQFSAFGQSNISATLLFSSLLTTALTIFFAIVMEHILHALLDIADYAVRSYPRPEQ
jgi:hypothetical protein